MIFKYDDKNYEIIIEKKKIKNLYIRVKEDLKIYISCNRFTSNKQIEKIINENYKSICNMLDKQITRIHNNQKFKYLGKEYDIVLLSNKTISILDNKIFVNSKEVLEKWLKKQTKIIFQERLNICIDKFVEPLPKVNLKIRNMKTRWGVCNRSNNNVTLNSNLIKYNEKIIDYVIFHELCHFIYPNHSKKFWELVSMYVPNWKVCRNELKQ